MVNLVLRSSFYYQLINSLIAVILCFPADQNPITSSLTGNLATNQDGSPSLLSSSLSSRNFTQSESPSVNRWFNVTSDLIGVTSKTKRFSSQKNFQQLPGANNEAIKKLIHPFIKDLITLSSEPIESGKSDGINLNNNYTDENYNKETDFNGQSSWDYRASSLSQPINDSAIVEDIFNRLKNPMQYLHSQSSSPIKQMKPLATATIDVSKMNKVSNDKPKDRPEIVNDGSVYYDNNWFLNRQGNMEGANRDTTSTLLPKSQVLVNPKDTNTDNNKANSDNKMIKESMFGMPDPNRWYYTKNIYDAEPTKSGSTEAKVRTKETKEQFKSEVTNGISTSTPIDQPSAHPNYPIFDEQIMLTSPHHNYLPHPHSHRPGHLNHHLPLYPVPHRPYRLPYQHIHPLRPYPNLFLHPHSIRRYHKPAPIAYSCCKVVYPSIHGKSLGSTLIPHGSSISKDTLPASSTTPAESVYGLNHHVETNCIPIYPVTSYPFGYGPRFVKTLPFALKIFKKALLFG